MPGVNGMTKRTAPDRNAAVNGILRLVIPSSFVIRVALLKEPCPVKRDETRPNAEDEIT
jgi:hypothetical protein